jgi:beta-N-acetylhexosaminidase
MEAIKKIFLLAIIGLSVCHKPLMAQEIEPFKNDSISLELMVGQMIITGIGDFSVISKKEKILEEIEIGHVGGVVLFTKNINKKNPKKELIKTIEALQAKSKFPLFISIDEEGGRVNRLKPKYGFPKTVSAQYLGELDNIDSTYFYASQTASTLKKLGINLNLAPNVDVNVNPKNPVIGGVQRSYSANELIVAKHAGQVVKAHRDKDVLTILKHFPGHGSSHADTHLGIADVTEYWQFKELMPYKYLIDSGLVDGIMTAHIINGHLDENKLPATLSPSIVSNILRKVFNYNGVVFSDDMQMHAISKHYGFEEGIKMAIRAGVDMLMFANTVEEPEKRTPTQIHNIIMNLVNSGEISPERIKESYDRIMILKQKI